MWNTIKLNRILLLLFLFVYTICYTQTYVVDQQFNNTFPAGWSTTTPAGWAAFNYGVNARSGAHCLRLSSASNGNGKYLYIPVNVQLGYTYTLSFWSKRICSARIIVNDETNQASPILSNNQTNSTCNSNWSTWYEWTETYVADFTGTVYFQILANTIYGGPTSIYIDDLQIFESPPVELPIELLYFKVNSNCSSELISKWGTASEFNVWKYIIMYSLDDNTYMPVDSIEDIGYSSVDRHYEMQSSLSADGCIVYVKLREIDYDGYKKDFEPESVYIPKRCKRGSSSREELYRYNIFGQLVDETYDGFVIILYSDNTTEYKIN